jgi:hypothetical protein
MHLVLITKRIGDIVTEQPLVSHDIVIMIHVSEKSSFRRTHSCVLFVIH